MRSEAEICEHFSPEGLKVALLSEQAPPSHLCPPTGASLLEPWVLLGAPGMRSHLQAPAESLAVDGVSIASHTIVGRVGPSA